MLRSKTRWIMEKQDEDKVLELQRELQLSPLLAGLLTSRGIDTPQKARKFLHGGTADFYDPFLLSGMDKAISRTKEAIHQGEPILIYGDYDADGVTSTSIMIHTMRLAGATFQYYIPNRFTEGYGLNVEALIKAAGNGFGLVITVDTGISAVEEVEKAKELGLDIIITDHHEPPSELPDAYAVVNPKKPGCTYPFDMLAGAGVAFKFAHALLGEFPHQLLDIAAIGTIADLVPLIDENRLIAKLGLQAIDQTANPGIQALKKICGVEGKSTAYDIGFGMGPRINATGRLETADRAVKMLVTDKPEVAEKYAEELDALNKERQELVESIAEQAIAMVLDMPEDERNVIVVAGEGWNEGVIGIVASRLVEKFYRPSIVLSIHEDGLKVKGSARSIAGFNMYEALVTCDDILPHYGGHPMAAGMTLALADVPELRQRLNQVASEWLTEEDYTPVTRVDAQCSLQDASLDTIDQLQLLAPFGIGNPSPRILIEEVELANTRTIGRDKNHLKCEIRQGEHSLDGIAFKMADIITDLSLMPEVRLVGELNVNEWNNTRRPQITIKDIEVPGLQIFDWRGSRSREERLDQLDGDVPAGLFVFRKHNLEALQQKKPRWQNIKLCPVSTGTGALDVRYIILYDLPRSLAELKSSLADYANAERIYCLFSEEKNALQAIPSREHFKEIYKAMAQHKFVKKQDIAQLARAKALEPGAAAFILAVFAELEFLNKSEEGYRLADQPARRDLTESSLYQLQRETLELETELLYSSYASLQQFIKQRCLKQAAQEEMVHGL
ncbi:single-stranded-DNA-specific exonuclease RecJ [Aneurinibacillus sp. Ricciae_BoGa-3]|uniref:single-stranded-DNA-specific exonuclease RecJ n=1 Tax=Aneurinibacillus sp. Ricciae_BoGa-3 TaxID=3022697 RepID=UPI00234124E0|nr:single-stranded-DNA-specific exonuclease RecJ [Aneurinibacillus sp. Ricciae_BoGa-3]WCK53608.1 single-stranded-DNA-specific exonuclease RecJ [Aneurinibacillus sp. Ricciae_BoGa-3]